MPAERFVTEGIYARRQSNLCANAKGPQAMSHVTAFPALKQALLNNCVRTALKEIRFRTPTQSVGTIFVNRHTHTHFPSPGTSKDKFVVNDNSRMVSPLECFIKISLEESLTQKAFFLLRQRNLRCLSVAFACPPPPPRSVVSSSVRTGKGSEKLYPSSPGRRI